MIINGHDVRVERTPARDRETTSGRVHDPAGLKLVAENHVNGVTIATTSAELRTLGQYLAREADNFTEEN
jgi:hypothetical protein